MTGRKRLPQHVIPAKAGIQVPTFPRCLSVVTVLVGTNHRDRTDIMRATNIKEDTGVEKSFGELREKTYTEPMPRAELQTRIEEFLRSHNICVLCTARDDVPRATPIEYYSDGTILYMTVDPGTKTENLKVNPRVSIAVSSVYYTDWTDWKEVKGIQITGTGILLSDGQEGHAQAQKAYKWQLYAKARGWDTSVPPKGVTFLKVVPQKIEYRDMSLMLEGFSPTQVWLP